MAEDVAAVGVRKLRERLGYTLERLARELGVSYTTVSKWERGRAHPSPLAQAALNALDARARRTGAQERTRHVSR